MIAIRSLFTFILKILRILKKAFKCVDDNHIYSLLIYSLYSATNMRRNNLQIKLFGNLAAICFRKPVGFAAAMISHALHFLQNVNKAETAGD